MSVVHCVCIIFLSLLALTYTSKLKSLDDIPGLQNNRIYLRNNQEVLEKLNEIIKGGKDYLQIVTDFDFTLTADPIDSGKRVLNSYEMLRLCPSIPQTYKDEDYKLFLKYKPLESDPNLSAEEKVKYMVEWYKASYNLLRGLKYPRDELKDIARNVTNSFREGVHTLKDWSTANNVPILVLSSGLGDSVVACLEAADLLTQNVKVISNFLQTDNNDIITGMRGETIHMNNKPESLRNSDYYKTYKNRTNVILMGDSIEDANMTDGMDNYNIIIKIGFLSSNKKSNLQTYQNLFDMVLENDQTMHVINSILNVM